MEQTRKTRVISFFKKHWIVSIVLAVLLLSTFTVRGRSVYFRYSVGPDVMEYVRVDYSIYGYCINVYPMNVNSSPDSRALTGEMLFMGMDESVQYLVKKWATGNKDEAFNIKVKGYVYNTNERRDEMIRMVRTMGHTADVIL